MRKSNYEVEVLVNGKSVDEYLHEGKIYIEGKEKSEFSIKVKNNGISRIVAIPTIDGLSVMDGEPASLKSRGYIVNGHDSITIDGWRTSDDKVAKFFFTSPEKAYAEKIEKGENIGVIGVAVFEEKPSTTITYVYEKFYPHEKIYPQIDPWGPRWPWGSPWINDIGNDQYTISCSSVNEYSTLTNISDSTSNNTSALYQQEVGTGFGEEKVAPVTTVSFDRKDAPSEVFEIFYNTREQLKKMGVTFKKPVYVTPSAFPADNGYCKPPKKDTK